MATPAYNTIGAIAHQYIIDNIAYQFQDANYLSFHYFDEKKGLENSENGTFIQVPLMLGEGSNSQMTSGDATAVLNLNVQDNAQNAVFDFKFYNNALVLTLEELAKAGQGENSVLDIARVKADDVMEQTVNFFASAIYGSGTDAGGKAFNGLGDVMAASGTAYGGLTDTNAGYARWLSERDTASATANYQAVGLMISRINAKSRRKSDKLDLMVSNHAVRSQFEQSQQGQQNYYNKTQLEAGFDGDFITVNGCRWYTDEFSPGTANGIAADNHLYFLCTNTLKFYRRFGFGVKSPMDTNQLLPTQPIKISVDHVVGNFVCNKRNSNGIMTAIVA